MKKITPVILSGGTGTRLWPLSRESYPKQLLPLVAEETLLQQTARRVADPALFNDLVVVANAEHRFVIAEQLRCIGMSARRIALEPMGRNTAPAALIAALFALRDDPESILLLMPADHAISDDEAFHVTLKMGIESACDASFVLFGIEPTAPVTGYGYIHMGKPVGHGVRKVLAFKEKPDLATAERYLASHDYAWNSGIFLLSARALIDEMRCLEPALLHACERAIEAGRNDLDFLRLDAAAFAEARSVSLDHALMERTKNAVVVPARFSWSDIGTWSALWQRGHKNAEGTVVEGNATAHNARDCYLRSDGPLVAALGVHDLIVVATHDAVLVTTKGRDQDVRPLVEMLRQSGHETATQTVRTYRPWGYYQIVHSGERFKVKRITVNPGAKLSLQKHEHRAEHWIVVNGTALVTRDNEETLLKENQSTYLPCGCIHRLENPGPEILILIEVQSGAYLGEDDILRLDDLYERA
ncbi:mannose-1-phosphate guanylyltransferase/mannose-6-phosphate isomerase [Microvirga terricola]|uniref:mannose-1-phosphate guanylyltransferase n=1 Tax=Microvirga terricola TaxID=2719797 RepID=A0ABX0V8Q5_9HYPH|nr:mannose-1-phosphate guanylyltransferase/mannose-6-phosphate isomerase [Microvirga terricola]NIX76199.1 mannose-1-phosphate guanylyltransferase/mannose-6-phosphate isomerase [Microvirga terricola]